MKPEEIAVTSEIMLLVAEQQIDELTAIAKELLLKLAEYESNDRLREIENYLW